MAGKSLSYFMREELKEEEVVEVPGPDTILDEHGKPVALQIRRLSQEHINRIYDNYRTEKIAMDKKRNQPYVVDGKVVMQEERDNRRAYRHVIADALAYPDLRDEKLMKFFGCVDVSAMPLKVFTAAEYDYVAKMVNQVIGIGGEGLDEEEDDLSAAKKLIARTGSLAWWSAYFLVNYGVLPEEFFKKPGRLQMFYIAAAMKAGKAVWEKGRGVRF